jgi:hypothetical protein
MKVKTKNKLSELLKRIGDDSHSEHIVIDDILKEIDNVRRTIPKEPNLSPFYSNIDELRGKYSSLASAISTISNRITQSSVDLAMKIKLSDESAKAALTETLESLNKIQEEVKKLAKEVKKPKGGGSIPLQISLNGTPINTRYCDLNLIVTATAANNDTSHKTDLTITSGGVGSWSTPPETPNGVILTFTVGASAPTDVEADGLLNFSPAYYTYAGGQITFINPPSFSVHYR